MIRQIAFFVVAASTVSLIVGCSEKGGSKNKVTQSGLKPEDSAKKAATYEGKVTKMLEMLGNPDEEMASRRVRGARAAANIAKDPNLPADEKEKLVDALKKASAAEKDQDALDLEKEALQALEQGPPGS